MAQTDTGAPGGAGERLQREVVERASFVDVRVGLDSIIGLIPGIGDAAAAALSLYIVAEAGRCGAPRGRILRMLANVAVDTVLGTIPIAGDLFDFGFKANRRNVDLLRAWLGAER